MTPLSSDGRSLTHPMPLRSLYIGVLCAIVMVSPLLVWPGLIRGLLTTDFLPHLYCYLSNPHLIWTHVIADTFIGFAYLAISVTLGYLIYKTRRDIPFHWMFLAFGLFIIACGGTHFMEVVTTWIPVYVFSAVVKEPHSHPSLQRLCSRSPCRESRN